MLKALEGSQAIARAVAACKPGVVAAYPITPQTHIVEGISKLVADGVFDTELVSVESEFSAASVVLGAAAAGSRAYTASSSQGIMLMAEVLFNIAGLRVPLVLTCANRAVGGPINIWNDQADSMAVRDSGWIQLYCADNQEAVDTTIQAFRIAEETEIPVMVCVDGFVLTHTLEPIDLPEQAVVDSFLPPYRFSRQLDPRRPLSIGTLVDPDWFTEVRHAHHQAMHHALEVIERTDADWQAATGRSCGGLIETIGPAEATTAILCIGSVCRTLEEAREDLPSERGEDVKLLKLRAFRPFPAEALRKACQGVTRLIVLERALSPGSGGIVGTEARAALSTLTTPPQVFNFAAGLGGRDMPAELLGDLLDAVETASPGTFGIIDAQLDKLAPEDR